MTHLYKMKWLLSILVVLAVALSACAGQQEVVGEEPAAEATEAPAAAEAEATEAPAEEGEAEAEAEATEAPAEEGGEETTAASEGDTILLGALAPLSAPGTVVGGEAMVDAMRIAEEELNASGGILGRPVELIIEDSEGLPERGTAAMEKLISQDGVVAVGGGYHSSVGVASKEVAADNGIPVVFAETWNDTITGDMQPEIFRIAPLNSEVSALDVQFILNLRDNLGYAIEKVVIVTENTDYGIPAAQVTSDGLAEAGIASETFPTDIGTQDFSGIMERVRAEDPDYIMVLNTGESAYNFIQQAAEAGIGPQDVPMQCNQVALESNAYWTNVPDGNLCFVRRVGLPVELYNDAATSFVERYTERTGKEAAESYALEAYDSIMIIAQAIEEAGSTESEAIISALENITYEGALGTITFPINSQNTPEDAGLEPKWWHQFPDPAITMVQYQEPGQDSTIATVVYPEIYQTGEIIWVGE